MTVLTQLSGELVKQLEAGADPSAVTDAVARLRPFVDDLDRLPSRPGGGVGYDALRDVAAMLGVDAASPGVRLYDQDHDYADWHRLARSAWFNWGDRDPHWSSASGAPRFWAAVQVFARFGPSDAFRIAEVGAGTARLTHDIRQHRPAADAWVGDAALDSLIMAAILAGGTRLELPRRDSFDRAPSGISWFLAGQPDDDTPTGEIEFSVASIPAGDDYDVIVALNSLSIFPEPLVALVDLVARLRPGGLLVVADLFCWRVETPPARRLLGPDMLVEFLRSQACSILSRQRGMPLHEDWGFERTYQWSSHGIVARRDGG